MRKQIEQVVLTLKSMKIHEFSTCESTNWKKGLPLTFCPPMVRCLVFSMAEKWINLSNMTDSSLIRTATCVGHNIDALIIGHIGQDLVFARPWLLMFLWLYRLIREKQKSWKASCQLNYKEHCAWYGISSGNQNLHIKNKHASITLMSTYIPSKITSL